MNIPQYIKPAAYGVAGGAIAAAILGFTWGGWVTAGTARDIAINAARDSREQLVASICVERFVASPTASADLAKLKSVSSWQRDKFVSDAGWTDLTAVPKDEQVSGAAKVCAARLVAMDAIPVAAPAEIGMGADG